MTLKGKFAVLSSAMIGIILASVITAANLLHLLMDNTAEALRASQMIERHMEADMLHDTLYGDAMRAAYGLEKRDVALVSAARASALENAKLLEKNVAQNISTNPSQEIAHDLQGLSSFVESYTQAVRAFMDMALQEHKGHDHREEAALAHLEKIFLELKEEMARVSDKMNDYALHISQSQAQEVMLIQYGCFAVAFLAISIALYLPFFSAAQVFRPLLSMILVMESIARGHLEADIPFEGREDEIGQVAKALQVFRQNARDKLKLSEEKELQKKQAELERRNAINGFAGHFETQVKDVVDTVAAAATEMDAVSHEVKSKAEGSASRLSALVGGISGASQNVQSVASAATELSASIDEIARQVTRAASITTAAVEEAKRANTAVTSLGDATQKIGTIVEIINDVTRQVNLLALNATIEAARAGEAGKGFAVVASEVKNLAGQTASATRDIQDQISFIQAAAANTVQVVLQITATINEISGISNSIAAAVEEQGAATQEIARNVQETANITSSITGNAEEVKETSLSTGVAVSQMIGAASELSQQAEALRDQVSAFLQNIKAA